jgi:uncharacterized membrane protein
LRHSVSQTYGGNDMQERTITPGTPGAAPPLPQHNDTPSATRTPVQQQDFAHAYRSGSASAYPAYATQRSSSGTRQLVTALGWFSIGLGVAQLLVPRTMSRAIGAPGHAGLMRGIGAREIAAGIGLLSRREPTGWLWTRVAGDAMDLALIGAAARSRSAQRTRLAAAAAAVAGIALLDLFGSMRQTREQTARSDTGGVRVSKSIVINLPPQECYRFWHDFENFPRFMKHLESVRITGENSVHWKAKAPAGTSVEWDAQLIADQPGKYLAWQSLEGSDIDNAGSVRFDPGPGGHGTVVRVDLEYSPPGGVAGALAAKLFGEEPEMQIDEDLRRFKWLIETGEIPTTIGQPSGPRGVVNRLLWRKGEPG